MVPTHDIFKENNIMKKIVHTFYGSSNEITRLSGNIMDLMLDGNNNLVSGEHEDNKLVVVEHADENQDMQLWAKLLADCHTVSHHWEYAGEVFGSVDELQQAVYDAVMSLPCNTQAERKGIARLINLSVAEVDDLTKRDRRARELFVEGELKTVRDNPTIYGWDNGGDLHAPLKFLYLPLDDGQIVDLMRRIEILYGDTNQKLEDWAVEYEVISRLLIHRKAVILNPQFLDLGNELDYILGKDMAELWHENRDKILAEKDEGGEYNDD